jgi:hypothetical protein
MRPTMQHAPILMALATALAAAPAAADLHRFTISGQLAAPDGATRPASLRLLCEPDPNGGAISMELWVPEAATRKDFDYADFEGPDAPAAEKMLTHVSVAGGGAIMATAAAAGWYSGENADTFVFGLSQRSHEPGAVATLLEAVDPRDLRLIWVQTSFDEPKRELRAMFALDPASVKQLRDTVDPCLPPAAKSSPAATKPAASL